MRTMRTIAAVVFLALLPSATRATGPLPMHWVGTWATSPMADGRTPPHFGMEGDTGTTLREVVHISIGGSSFRVTLTNEFGRDALTIGAAQIALKAPGAASGNDIVAGSSLQLSFSGRPSVTIPPGALVISDPVPLKAAALSDLAVSLFIPEQTISSITYHSFADTSNFMAAGNDVTTATLIDSKPTYSWQFLKGVDVMTDAPGAVVAFGDSITDGAHSSRDANARWPDELARRLGAKPRTALGVLNEGIGGNRILHDNSGPSALARFDRDVIAQAGVKYLIILEAINDIGHATDPKKPYDIITAEDLIAGYTQMVLRAHTHGIKVYLATVTPFVGAGYQSPAGEQMRQTVNAFIRSNHIADGFIDFDKTTQDPANPTVFLPADDSGDHLHPGDAGYKAMGDSIDLSLFTR
jgi:lysophospholipase L1-like esterase